MAKIISQQSMENREYVRRLLKEKQPEFSAALELAADLVGRELRSRETQCDFSASEVLQRPVCPAGSAKTNTGRHEMPATTQPVLTRLNVKEAWCEALFASTLQPSDSPTADMAAHAVVLAVRQFGVRGCAGRMAQEFGDHPHEAVSRMRWVRQLTYAAGEGR